MERILFVLFKKISNCCRIICGHMKPSSTSLMQARASESSNNHVNDYNIMQDHVALKPREVGLSSIEASQKNMYSKYSNQSAVRTSKVSGTVLSKSSSHSSLNRASIQPVLKKTIVNGDAAGASPLKLDNSIDDVKLQTCDVPSPENANLSPEFVIVANSKPAGQFNSNNSPDSILTAVRVERKVDSEFNEDFLEDDKERLRHFPQEQLIKLQAIQSLKAEQSILAEKKEKSTSKMKDGHSRQGKTKRIQSAVSGGSHGRNNKNKKIVQPIKVSGDINHMAVAAQASANKARIVLKEKQIAFFEGQAIGQSEKRTSVAVAPVRKTKAIGAKQRIQSAHGRSGNNPARFLVNSSGRAGQNRKQEFLIEQQQHKILRAQKTSLKAVNQQSSGATIAEKVMKTLIDPSRREHQSTKVLRTPQKDKGQSNFKMNTRVLAIDSNSKMTRAARNADILELSTQLIQDNKKTFVEQSSNEGDKSPLLQNSKRRRSRRQGSLGKSRDRKMEPSEQNVISDMDVHEQIDDSVKNLYLLTPEKKKSIDKDECYISDNKSGVNMNDFINQIKTPQATQNKLHEREPQYMTDGEKSVSEARVQLTNKRPTPQLAAVTNQNRNSRSTLLLQTSSTIQKRRLNAVRPTGQPNTIVQIGQNQYQAPARLLSAKVGASYNQPSSALGCIINDVAMRSRKLAQVKQLKGQDMKAARSRLTGHQINDDLAEIMPGSEQHTPVLPPSQMTQANNNDSKSDRENQAAQELRNSTPGQQYSSQKSLSRKRMQLGQEAVSAYIPNPQLSNYNFTGIKVNDRLLESAKSGSRLGRRYSQEEMLQQRMRSSLTRSHASAKELGNSSASPVKHEAAAASMVDVEPLMEQPETPSKLVVSTENIDEKKAEEAVIAPPKTLVPIVMDFATDEVKTRTETDEQPKRADVIVPDRNILNQIKITEKLINLKTSGNEPLAKILSPTATKKCYIYQVYRGNYPQQLENALLKRGVWKRFDRDFYSRKKATNKALLNSATPNQRKRVADYNKNTNNMLSTSLTVGQSLQLQKQKTADVVSSDAVPGNRSDNKLGMESPSQETTIENQSLSQITSIQQLHKIQAQALNNLHRFEEQLLKNAGQYAAQLNDFDKSDGMANPDQQAIADARANDELVIEKCHFVWKPVNYADRETQRKIDRRLIRQNSNNPLIYNHFEHLRMIATKSGLVRSLKQYYYTNQHAKNQGYQEFDTLPTTFIVKARANDDATNELMLRYKQIQKGNAVKERLPAKHCQSNMWLVKPTNANQGRGIEIFTELDKMLNFINSRQPGTLCVVQKYIERPLLYRNRKFDIRVWAVMTTKNEIYYFREGYLRTSSSEYTLDNENQFVHLTNQCLQVKNKETYAAFEEGNTLSFAQFQAYLDSEEFRSTRPDLQGRKIKVERDLVPRMKDIVIDTFCAVKNQLNPGHRKNHYELFGYDFMVDEDFRVWLIEVNSNPYIGTPNEYISKLVPNMIDEMLQIVLDPYYPPSREYRAQAAATATKDKGFELIYQELLQPRMVDHGVKQMALGVLPSDEKLELQPSALVNQRRPFNHALLYPLDIPKHYSNHQKHVSFGLVGKKGFAPASSTIGTLANVYGSLEGNKTEKTLGSAARNHTVHRVTATESRRPFKEQLVTTFRQRQVDLTGYDEPTNSTLRRLGLSEKKTDILQKSDSQLDARIVTSDRPSTSTGHVAGKSFNKKRIIQRKQGHQSKVSKQINELLKSELITKKRNSVANVGSSTAENLQLMLQNQQMDKKNISESPRVDSDHIVVVEPIMSCKSVSDKLQEIGTMMRQASGTLFDYNQEQKRKSSEDPLVNQRSNRGKLRFNKDLEEMKPKEQQTEHRQASFDKINKSLESMHQKSKVRQRQRSRRYVMSDDGALEGIIVDHSTAKNNAKEASNDLNKQLLENEAEQEQQKQVQEISYAHTQQDESNTIPFAPHATQDLKNNETRDFAKHFAIEGVKTSFYQTPKDIVSQRSQSNDDIVQIESSPVTRFVNPYFVGLKRQTQLNAPVDIISTPNMICTTELNGQLSSHLDGADQQIMGNESQPRPLATQQQQQFSMPGDDEHPKSATLNLNKKNVIVTMKNNLFEHPEDVLSSTFASRHMAQKLHTDGKRLTGGRAMRAPVQMHSSNTFTRSSNVYEYIRNGQQPRRFTNDIIPESALKNSNLAGYKNGGILSSKTTINTSNKKKYATSLASLGARQSFTADGYQSSPAKVSGFVRITKPLVKKQVDRN